MHNSITKSMKQKKLQISGSYIPSEKEEFMCSKQIEYFKKVLTSWRNEIIQGSSSTIDHLKEESSNKPDTTDRASIESERSLELRTRDRERKLLSKINKALKKLEDGSYGYCEETMQPISIKRLVARPIATLSVEAQEMHEKSEKIYKEKEY
ncbi:MAG: RNA polymerase-binding protein DksA [Alphaproteobacteria bacterium]